MDLNEAFLGGEIAQLTGLQYLGKTTRYFPERVVRDPGGFYQQVSHR